MDSKNSSNNDHIVMLGKEEAAVITLFLCEFDSSEEDDYTNSSQNSIESSELVEDSDNEAELITEIFTLNKKYNKLDKTN